MLSEQSTRYPKGQSTLSDLGASVPRRGSGFSLVELMIAITLGLLLTAGMIQLFSSTKVTFRTNDALARIQENGRFTMELLKRELREAGDSGFCATPGPINNHLRQDCGGGLGALFGTRGSLLAWEYNGTGSGDDYEIPISLAPSSTASDWSSSLPSSGSLPTALVGQVAPGSDVLIVRRIQAIPDLTATGATGANANSIPLTGGHGLPDDAIVLVTNCTQADLFQNRSNASASTFSKGGGSCSNPGPGNDNDPDPPNSSDWRTPKNDSMQALQVILTAYYIGVDTSSGEPGLYMLDLGNGTETAAATPQELVRGAENLQVELGYSRSGPVGDGQSVDDWLTASEIPALGWQQVLSLRIGVVIRSQEIIDGTRPAQDFALARTTVKPQADGRLRQTFSSTIALRNRILVMGGS